MAKDLDDKGNYSSNQASKKKYRGFGRIAIILFIGLSAYMLVSTIVLIFLTKPKGEVEVPYVVGKRFVDVYNSISRSGLKADISFYDVFDIDNGIILNQHPDSGVIVSEGSRFKLVLSRSNLYVDVPNLIGLKLPFALNKLKNLHLYNRSVSLNPGIISYIPSEKTSDNIVIDQSPRAGEEIAPDTKINILVSAGALNENMKMPNIIGQSIELSINLLYAKGLNLYEEIKETRSKKMSGIIMSQSPKKEKLIKKGDKVDLKVYYYPMKERPYVSYDRLDYKIPSHFQSGMFEVYIQDNRSKRKRFSRKMKGDEDISFIYHRTGNARISIIYNKKVIEIISRNVQNFE